MCELTRRQRATACVLLLALVLGGATLAFRRSVRPPVVIRPGAAPDAPAGEGRAEAADREGRRDLAEESGQVTVHVCGAVNDPGVYTLPEGARVADAVVCAGGLAPNAGPDSVNMAARLMDSAQVYIPERAAASTPGDGPLGAPDLGQNPGIPSYPAVGASTGKISINTATVSELQRLPGIGPALSQRIVDFRSSIGRFERPEQLMEVSGIGLKKYEALANLITTY